MTLSEIRRRPTLPGRFQPSTISVLRLNFCVRDGNRWIPQAIVTGNMGLSRWCAPASPSLAFWRRFALPGLLRFALFGSLLRFAPLCSPFPSHPQTRTGSGDSFSLTLASFLTLRHSRFASAPLPLGLCSALASLQLAFRFASAPLLSQIFPQIKPSTD